MLVLNPLLLDARVEMEISYRDVTVLSCCGDNLLQLSLYSNFVNWNCHSKFVDEIKHAAENQKDHLDDFFEKSIIHFIQVDYLEFIDISSFS